MDKKIDFYSSIELQVSFEYDTPLNHWSEPVLDLEVKDQMVSFRTPRFPFSIDQCITVDIVLKQKRRSVEPMKFDYIPSGNQEKYSFSHCFQLNLRFQSYVHNVRGM